MRILHNILRIVFIFFLSISPYFAFADSNLTGTIDYTPANPKPFEKVNLTVKSFSFDVDASQISWYVNKILIKKGPGEKNFSFPLGAANTPFYVGVSIITPGKEVFQTAVTITPHFTPLLTEAIEGYIPPFYEGRALYGEGSKVKVVAYPIVSEGDEVISKKDLIYRWQVNTIPFSQESGLGKNTFIVRQDELENENNVVVSVTSKTGETNLEERVSVKPYEITPLFYAYDPLFGIDLTKAYENTIFIKKAVKLFYAPYNFAYAKRSTIFNWALNGIPITTDSDFLVSLIPNEKSKGVNTLNISSSHPTKQLQTLNSNFIIDFNTNENE